jgi:hypothetical protein
MFDLAHLALETDSTRLITIMLAGSTSPPPIEGVSLGHHDLSHHGKDPGKIAQLEIVERETIKTLHGLLAKLAWDAGGERYVAGQYDGVFRQQSWRCKQSFG